MKRFISCLMICSSMVGVNLPGFCFALTPKVTALEGGGGHTVTLREDKTLWVYGENGSGQLGDGTNVKKNTPTRLATISDVVSMVAGQWHTLAVKADGTVWAWGWNGSSQLGDGTTTNSLIPVQVKDPSDPSGFLTGVIRVAAGERYSMALKSNGTVWTWGYNYSGQLGDGTYVGKTAPVQVKDPSDPSGFLKGVSAITAGGGHSVAIKTSGTVWTWGTHDYAVIGRPYAGTGSTPQEVAGQVAGLTDVIAIAAGWEHTVALKGDGTVWACGRNLEGQLGDGTTESSFFPPPSSKFFVQVEDATDPTGYLTGAVGIAADGRHSVALKGNGTGWGWGANSYGELCDGTQTNRLSATKMKDPSDASGFLTGVKGVGAGDYHTLLLKDDGSVWGCGGNYSGQLGTGTYDSPRLTPVKALIPEYSLIYAWGPGYITPGEEATFLIEYNNITTEVLRDVVVIFHIPGGYGYVSSTSGGIYRDDRNQVFWKLGNLNPGSKGLLTLKMEIPWGLALHTEITMFVDLIAGNIPSSMNLDDYLSYVPVEISSEKEYTPQETNALLSSDQKLKELFDYALSLGYVFDNVVRRYNFSDGSSPLVFVLFDPKDFTVAFIEKSGDTVFMERYEDNTHSVFDRNGGFSLNLTDESLKGWGTWAEAHSLDTNRCIYNCTTMTAPEWIQKVINKSKFNYMRCQYCQEALREGRGDPEDCALCAQRYLQLHIEKGRTGRLINAVGKCVEDCKKDSKRWECSPDEKPKTTCVTGTPGDIAVMTGTVPERWYVKHYYCLRRDNIGAQWSFQYAEECEYICSFDTGQCVEPCDEKKSQSSTASEAADPPICEKCLTPVKVETSVAHDPNAKSVDFKGNVIPGQKLTYTIEYENLGEGTAYGVFILDPLDSNLDETTLDMKNGGTYSSASRSLGWDIGTLPSKGKGSVTFSAKVKSGLPSGVEIVNIADVHFPSANEITPTNPVVNRVKAIAADPKSVETTSEVAVPITLSGRDSGSSPLTYRITQSPSYGTLTGAPPNVVYTSMEDFSGGDEFYYVVNNGLVDSDLARVVIKVNPSPGDTNPPTVVSTSPKSNAKDVHVNPNPMVSGLTVYSPTISATFSEPIDATTITTSTFTVNGGITGSVTYDEQGWTASFVPSKALSSSTTYTVKLAKGIKDKAGNAMAGEYSWQFTTESPANIVVILPDDATEVNFEEVQVNQVSQEKVVNIQNTGTLNLVLGVITKVGANSGDFQITEDRCSGKTLAQSENCTVKVAFQPLSPGNRAASLSIPSNDSDTPNASASLKGKGTGGTPKMTVSPLEVNFGKVVKGSSLDQTITVRNDGDGSLAFSAIGSPAVPFTLAAGGTCTASTNLSPAGSCTIVVRFSPTVQGLASSSFSVTSNDPNKGSVSVSLSGQGAQFVVNPSEGTIGSLLTITGSGFGGKKGKVVVAPVGLKVVDWSSGAIHASLGKAMSPDAAYDVVVTPGEPRGAKPITETGAFTVRSPQVTGGSYHGLPGATLTLTGKFFGTAKGKVYVGSSSCKVTSWAMNTATGESTIVFVVPTKIAKGSYDLGILNAVGLGTTKFTVD